MLIVNTSSLTWAQDITQDRLALAKKLQECYQSQVTEHVKLVKQINERLVQNLKKVEELEEDEKVKKEVSIMTTAVDKKLETEESCIKNPKKHVTLEEKIKDYKDQNIALGSIYTLNRKNLDILYYEVPLIEGYIKYLKTPVGQNSLNRVVELERTNEQYSKNLTEQNVLKDSLKLSFDIPECTSTLKELRKLH